MIRSLILAVLAAVALPAASAQLDEAAYRPPIATVRFTSNQPGNPPYYSLAITSMGSASYRSLPNSDQRTGEPYMMRFAVSAATREKIFQLARRLHLLRGDFQTTYPDTWTKSLTFADGPIQHEILYTASKNQFINRLTTLFERISATLECGRRLEDLRAANPEGVESELMQMQQLLRHGRLAEVHAIAPGLQTIASDPAIPEVAREHAGGILEQASRNAYRGSAFPS